MPVMPGRSLTDPTFATQPAATFGSPLRGTISTVRPLSRTNSCTAPAGRGQAGRSSKHQQRCEVKAAVRQHHICLSVRGARLRLAPADA